MLMTAVHYDAADVAGVAATTNRSRMRHLMHHNPPHGLLCGKRPGIPAATISLHRNRLQCLGNRRLALESGHADENEAERRDKISPFKFILDFSSFTQFNMTI